VLNPIRIQYLFIRDIILDNNVDKCSAKLRRGQVLFLLPEPLPPHHIIIE
jgi:hypothetical protein